MTIKTVWVNGTERLVERNMYGVYELFVDYNDLIWLNKIHKKPKAIRVPYAKPPKEA